MIPRLRALTLAALLATPLAAQQTGPIIRSGGQYTPVPNPSFPVPKGLSFKVAWDISTAAAKPSEANGAFGGAARMLNMSVDAGVRREQMQLAIVVHGATTEELLTDAEYRTRKGTGNPNIPLLKELAEAGVQIILCGQAAAGRKVTQAQLLSGVTIAPSATWAYAVLGAQGYIVIPF